MPSSRPSPPRELPSAVYHHFTHPYLTHLPNSLFAEFAQCGVRRGLTNVDAATRDLRPCVPIEMLEDSNRPPGSVTNAATRS